MKKKSFKLISGDYSPSDARSILMNMFYSKIQFHSMFNLGYKERNGKEHVGSTRRQEQLKKAVNDLSDLLDQFEGEKGQIQIKAYVEITKK